MNDSSVLFLFPFASVRRYVRFSSLRVFLAIERVGQARGDSLKALCAWDRRRAPKARYFEPTFDPVNES